MAELQPDLGGLQRAIPRWRGCSPTSAAYSEPFPGLRSCSPTSAAYSEPIPDCGAAARPRRLTASQSRIAGLQPDRGGLQRAIPGMAGLQPDRGGLQRAIPGFRSCNPTVAAYSESIPDFGAAARPRRLTASQSQSGAAARSRRLRASQSRISELQPDRGGLQRAIPGFRSCNPTVSAYSEPFPDRGAAARPRRLTARKPCDVL